MGESHTSTVPPLFIWGSSERFHAYKDTLAELGIPFDPALVSPPFFFETLENDYTLSEWIKTIRGFERVAIVGHNDIAALSAIRLCQSLGIRVPKDMAIVGFDNIDESRYVTPPLTTVRPPFYEMGLQAVDYLFDLLAGKSVPEITRLSTPLIVRRSCGCQDSTVTWASSGLRIRDESDAEATISIESLRDQLIAAIGHTCGSIRNAWSERFVNAFLGELRGGEEGAFLRDLEETLYEALLEGSDISIWQEAISALRRLSLPHVAASESRKAEDLFQQARVMVGAATQRQQVSAGQEIANRHNILQKIQDELIANFNIERLISALAVNLPRLRISGCYLSLYENPQPYRYPQAAPKDSRLLLALVDEGNRDEAREGTIFLSKKLIPDEIWPEGEAFVLAAHPIYFQANQLGFVLFKVGVEDGTVYETLRGLISSALEGAMLIQQEQKRGNQLRAAAIVSRASSSVVESDELIERAVTLISTHFGTAHVGLYLVDEASGAPTLRFASGEAVGRSDGSMLASVSDSLVRACVEDTRKRIGVGAASDATSLLSTDRSEMALPLASRGRVKGVLSVRCAVGDSFDDDEVKVLQTLSDQIANGLENASLFDAYKRAEGELKQERNLLRTIIDQIPEFIYVKDRQSRFLMANRQFALMKGLEKAELLIGKTDRDFFKPELAAEYFAEESKIMDDGLAMLDHEHCRSDDEGNTVWILTSKIPLRDNRDEIIGLVGVSRDITERKRNEEAMLRQSTQLQTALDVAGTVNALLDVERILKCVADLIRDKFGYYSVGIFLVEEDGTQAVLRAHSSAVTPDTQVGTISLEVGSQSMISYAISSSMPRIAQDVSADPFYLAVPGLPDTRSEAVFPMLVGEAPIGAIDVQSDKTEAFPPDTITVLKTMAYQIAIAVQNARLHADEQERSRELSEAYKALKDNQERSLLSEKMASLGRLTAGIAHEMNTPLAALRAALVELGNLTDEYEKSIGDPSVDSHDHAEIAEEMKASIKLANSAADRASGFVKGIKTQTRNIGQVESQLFNAVPVIEDSLLLLNHALLKAKCSLGFEHSSKRIDLIGSPGQLAQVLTNLVTNAIDASEEKGKGSIAIILEPRADGIELCVADKGMGIPPQNLSRIFDPLFTTKPIGQGTGLGLTIVHDIIVSEFGGKIDVASELGEGTTFTLSFPLPDGHLLQK